MSATNASVRGGASGAVPWRDSVAVAVVTFMLFRLLAQDTFYGPDGRAMVKVSMSGMVAHPHHVLYLPMLRAAHAVVESWGGSWYAAGLLLSQVGTALGAFAWHRAAAAAGLARGACLALVALCVSTPAIAFFASVMELHAPFLAFAGTATWAALALARRPGVPRALMLGCCTGVAVGAHATAHLLVLWLLPLVAGESARRPRPLSLLFLASCVHVAVTLALPALLRTAGAPVRADAGLQLVLSRVAQAPWNEVPAQVWMDWLWPFLPLSFVVCFGARRAALAVLWLAVGVAASIGVTWTLMAPGTENGAYLLPLAWPAALVVVRTLPPRVWFATIAIGSVLGFAWVVRHDRDRAHTHAYAADLRQLAVQRPLVLICGQHLEFDACMIGAPEIVWREFINEVNLPPEVVPQLVAGLLAFVAEQERAGGQVFLTEGAWEFLRAPVAPEQRTGPALRSAIAVAFTLEPVQGQVLRAFRLRPR